jgi:hypothetical protein
MHLPDAQVHTALSALFRSGGTGYVGLSTTTPTDDSTGNITEPTGGGYARVALPLSASGFGAPSGRAIETVVASTFPAPTGDWGTVLAWVMFTTQTGLTVIASGRLATGKSITAGSSRPVLPAGTIRIQAP